MFKVHTLDSFRDTQLYMHDTQDMIYFVDTSHVHQTILLRLPPVFVLDRCESHIDYVVPQAVLDTFRRMERHARSFFEKDPLDLNNNAPVLRTQWSYAQQPTTDVGQFVEVVVAIVGIEKNLDKGWSFVYRTVQVRAVEIVPPSLDESVQSVDLFST